MNKGLNRKSTYFKKEVGSSGTFTANLNKNEGGFYILLPGYETPGLSPIAFNLYFSSFNLNSTSAYGAAIRESYYYELTDDYENLRVYLKDSFGSIKEYHFVKDANTPGIIRRVFECSEDHSRIERDTYDILPDIYYNLFDKYGNKIILLKNRSYPVEIVYKSGERYTFSSRRNITNNLGTTLEISTDYRTITFKKETTEIYKIELVVENNLISKMIHKKPIISDTETTYETLYTNEYIVDTTNKSVTIIDVLSNYRVKFNYIEQDSTYLLTSYIESYNESFNTSNTTTITYNEDLNYTRVLSYLGEYEDYYFNESGLLSKKINSLGQIELYEYGENDYISKHITNINHTYSNIGVSSLFRAYFHSNNQFIRTDNQDCVIEEDNTNLYSDLIGNKVLLISNENGINVYEKEINRTGMKNEFISFYLWSKLKISNNVENPVLIVKIELLNNETIVKTIEEELTNINWEFNTYSYKVENDYSNIKVSISSAQNATYMINAFVVSKTPLINYNVYDNYGNLVESSFENKNSQTIYQDQLIRQQYSTNRGLKRYKYNYKNLPIKEISNNGLIKEYTYNEQNQVTKETLRYNNKYMERNDTYLNGYLNSSTDFSSYLTTYNINEHTGIVNSITNALGDQNTYIYNDRDEVEELIVSKDQNTTNIRYIYKNYRKNPVLDKVILKDNSIYQYVYDNYDRVIMIDYYPKGKALYKKTMVEYTYQNLGVVPTSNITKVTKYNSNTSFIYNYDYLGVLRQSRIIQNGTIIFQKNFTYDKDLKLHTEGNNLDRQNYFYDEYNRVRALSDNNGKVIEYTYDDYNNVILKKQNLLSKIKYIQYDYPSTINNNTLSAIAQIEAYGKFFTTFYNYFDENNNRSKILYKYIEDNSPVMLTPQENNISVISNNTFSKLDFSNGGNGGIKYPLFTQNLLNYSFTIGFWFYISEADSNITLFETKYDYHATNTIKLEYINKTLVLCFYSNGTDNIPEFRYTEFPGQIEVNQWHFVAFSVSSLCDGTVNANHFGEIYIDGVYKQQSMLPSYDLYIQNGQLFSIGSRIDNDNKLNGYIGPIMYSESESLSCEDLDSYYQLTKKYLINNVFNNDELDYSQNSTTSIYELKNSVDVYPLNNSFNSLNKNKPYNFEEEIKNEYDSFSYFKYNDIIKRSAYVADGNLLQYKFETTNTGHIKFRFYIEETFIKQSLIELKTENLILRVFRNKDKFIQYEYENSLIEQKNTYNTNITLENDQWINFGLIFEPYNESLSKVTLLFNNQQYQNTATPLLCGNIIFSIGRCELKEQLIEDITYNKVFTPLYGLIEQLTFGNTIISLDQLSYTNDYDMKTFSNKSDAFGLLIEEVNINNDITELVKEYSYKTIANTDSTSRVLPIINNEIYKYKNNTSLINYDYDDIGRIIYKYTSEDKIVRYEYNYDNTLSKELYYDIEDTLNLSIGYRYEYGLNGNIKKVYRINSNGAETLQYSYVYDTIYPDRLQRINALQYKYDDSNFLYPIKYGHFDEADNHLDGLTFIWEDTLLTNVSIINNNTVQSQCVYDYDKGTKLKRTKTLDGVTTNFYYDDNNLLIKEVSPNIEKEYIYDSNGLIKELIILKDNVKYRYIYLKDILGNVIGLLDEDLNKVASYEYYAFGIIKQQSSTVTSPFSLLVENPFKYRGYYFDNTLNMYYCQTRYYNPITRRWLSPDNIDYLDPTNINGMNLYCYCGNNPVNYKQRPVSSGGSITDSAFSGTLGVVFVPIVGVTGGSSGIFNYTLKCPFRNGLLFGSGSITSLYADWNARAQISLRKGTVKVGIAGKFSVLNVSGQIGFGTENLNLSVKAVGDALTVSGMAGIFIDPKKNTYFIGAEAKATALSGRVGGQLDIFGLQIEVGLSGELGSIGGRVGIGLKPTEDGKMQFYYGSGFALGVGWDFYIRIQFDELF